MSVFTAVNVIPAFRAASSYETAPGVKKGESAANMSAFPLLSNSLRTDSIARSSKIRGPANIERLIWTEFAFLIVQLFRIQFFGRDKTHTGASFQGVSPCLFVGKAKCQRPEQETAEATALTGNASQSIVFENVLEE